MGEPHCDDDDYYWMGADGTVWLSKAQDHAARGRCSGIPDCCVAHYLAGGRPVNDWGYAACPACVIAGNRVEVRDCDEQCSCGQWASRVRVEDDLSDLEGGPSDERAVIDQLRAQLAAAEERIAHLEDCPPGPYALRLEANIREFQVKLAAAERRAVEAEGRLASFEGVLGDTYDLLAAAEKRAVEAEQHAKDLREYFADAVTERDALRAEVAKLQAEVFEEINDACDAAREDHAEIDRLKAALRKYGHHATPCELMWWTGEELLKARKTRGCNCGFDAALNADGGEG